MYSSTGGKLFHIETLREYDALFAIDGTPV